MSNMLDPMSVEHILWTVPNYEFRFFSTCSPTDVGNVGVALLLVRLLEILLERIYDRVARVQYTRHGRAQRAQLRPQLVRFDFLFVHNTYFPNSFYL